MDYSKPLRIGFFKKIKPIDIMSGNFTFGHRLWLGKATQESKTDFALMQAVFDGLHDIKIRPKQVAALYEYFEDILEKLKKWCEYEKQLHYEPTPEERRAGIDVIGRKLKEFATIDSVATRMHISHNDALKLSYEIVFKMLLKDMEQSRFERKLNKIYADKR